MRIIHQFWLWHDARGVIAGPFKTRKRAEARMRKLIRESAGQALWLEVDESIDESTHRAGAGLSNQPMRFQGRV